MLYLQEKIEAKRYSKDVKEEQNDYVVSEWNVYNVPSVGDYYCVIIDEAYRGYTLDREMTDSEVLNKIKDNNVAIKNRQETIDQLLDKFVSNATYKLYHANFKQETKKQEL